MDKSTWKDYYRYEYPKFWVKQVKEYGFTKYHQLMLNLLDARRGEHILECGIGTGEPLALRLARDGVVMYGIDISQNLLEECKKNTAAWDDISYVLGDIESLPFDAGTFDKTYCLSTTWYLPNLEKALQEMFRVTKRGGGVLFDIINVVHVTQAIGHLTTFFKKNPSTIVRSHFQIDKMLKNIGVNYKMKGCMVLLPVGLPLLYDKADLCKYSDLFSYGLQDSILRYFGAKLVYICKKR